MEDLVGLAEQVSAPFSLASLALNLAVGLLISIVTAWHYRRFGQTLSNREELGKVLPFVVLTTCFIITVVKSSLALSLGLVGALSIVRFRTPIKEPEELAYLFFTIAVGLGLGAGYTLETTVAAALMLTAMAAVKSSRASNKNTRLFLTVDIPGEVADGALEKLTACVADHANAADLRRYDVAEQGLQSTWVLDLDDEAKLGKLTDALRGTYPAASVTFLDQRQLPSA